MVSPELQTFNEKQNGIYDKFRAAQEAIATNGLQVDEAGTELQSGFLVAFRPPLSVAADMAVFSSVLNYVSPAVRYGYYPGRMDNAHITISDFDLQKGRNLSHQDEGVVQTATLLTKATEAGIKNAGGSANLADSRVRLDGVAHNGKVAIITGEANDPLFAVRSEIIKAAGSLGIEGFNGAWGAHSTISRVLEAQEPGSREVLGIQALLASAPNFGDVRPASIDVGYFNTNPEQGFMYTPIESFDIPTGTRMSMY